MLNGLGCAYIDLGDYQSARACLEEALALGRELERELRRPYEIGSALFSLAVLASSEADFAAARAAYAECLTYLPEWRAICQLRLAQVAYAESDFATAEQLALEYYQHWAWGPQRKGEVQLLLGACALHKGDLAEARSHFIQSLRYFHQLGMNRGFAQALQRLGSLALAQEQFERAARLYGGAAGLQDAKHIRLASRREAEVGRAIAQLRERLGEEAFSAAWEAGRAMDWEQAVAYALEADQP